MKTIDFSLDDFSVMSETKLDRYVQAMNEAIKENVKNEEVFEYITKKIN